jgi:hypothetical protein
VTAVASRKPLGLSACRSRQAGSGLAGSSRNAAIMLSPIARCPLGAKKPRSPAIGFTSVGVRFDTCGVQLPKRQTAPADHVVACVP